MWASGIRPPRIEGEWYPLALRILNYTFPDLAARGRTGEAEAGLAIEPSCYWYVWRADELYGEVVFLWRESGSAVFVESDGSVAPFDSGGFWHGLVKSSEILDDSGKAAFFLSACMDIREWRGHFLAYIEHNYANPERYVDGHPPAFGTAGIIAEPPNLPPAWTWEARVARSRFRKQVVVDSIFWLELDRLKFETFLEAAAMDDDEMTSVAALLQESSVICAIGLAPGFAAKNRLGVTLREAMNP